MMNALLKRIGFIMTACLFAGTTVVMGQGLPAELQQTSESKPQNWRTFSSTEGRFVIAFPGTPKVSEQLIENPDARLVVVRFDLRTFAEYQVLYADYPKYAIDMSTPDLLLDEAAKGVVAEVNAQLLSISNLLQNGYPARLLRQRLPNGSVMQVKMVLVVGRMYRIAITTPSEEGRDPAIVGFYNSTASKFLDSFGVILTGKTGNPSLSNDDPPRGCPPDSSNCVTVTEEELRTHSINLPQPAYPPIARAARASGSVEVQVAVNEAGNVIAAHCISGHPLLQAAAVAAARYARFTPPVVDNKPARMVGVIRYTFVLE